ncbi:hypothetical protein HPP92_010159 [Vanilla planifolia]|uniref:Uncharacterized protein n=1 Tax=Vanilla planifolia TaxID=51239 RepID=A0A835QTE2_VANPL|nr:hypothetical protein HPP92_010159 [Vanilla planifolia]
MDVLYTWTHVSIMIRERMVIWDFSAASSSHFSLSRVRKMLIDRGAELHPTEVCPYCKAKIWSMLQAKMVPKSACSRLGAYEDCLDYYVCLNGHMLGICSLLPLSDSDEASELQ